MRQRADSREHFRGGNALLTQIVALQIIDDLADLSTVEVEQDGRRALLRTAPRASIDPICRAVGVALPPGFQVMPSSETQPGER